MLVWDKAVVSKVYLLCDQCGNGIENEKTLEELENKYGDLMADIYCRESCRDIAVKYEKEFDDFFMELLIVVNSCFERDILRDCRQNLKEAFIKRAKHCDEGIKQCLEKQ